jgi:hypothetical protein
VHVLRRAVRACRTRASSWSLLSAIRGGSDARRRAHRRGDRWRAGDCAKDHPGPARAPRNRRRGGHSVASALCQAVDEESIVRFFQEIRRIVDECQNVQTANALMKRIAAATDGSRLSMLAAVIEFVSHCLWTHIVVRSSRAIKCKIPLVLLRSSS